MGVADKAPPLATQGVAVAWKMLLNTGVPVAVPSLVGCTVRVPPDVIVAELMLVEGHAAPLLVEMTAFA